MAFKVYIEDSQVVIEPTISGGFGISSYASRWPINDELTAAVVNTSNIKITQSSGADVVNELAYTQFQDKSGTALGASASATATALNALFETFPTDNFLVKDPNSDNSGTTKIRHKTGTGGEDRDEGGTLELDTHAASIGLYGSYLEITETDLNNTTGKTAAYGRLQLFLESLNSPYEVLNMSMGNVYAGPVTTLNTGTLTVNGAVTMTGDVTLGNASNDTITFGGTTSGIDYNDLSNKPSAGATTAVSYARMTMSSDKLRNGANAQDYNGTADVDVAFDTQDTIAGSEITTNTTTYKATVQSDGFYRLTANISFYSVSVRATPAVVFNVNGSVIPGESIGYIRASSGNNEASGNVTRVVQLSANDTVNVCCHDESTATGSIFAEQGTFEIEKLEVAIDTDFSNITSTPTTLAGYGITDAPTATSDLTNDSGFITAANDLDGIYLEVSTRTSAYGASSFEGQVIKFGTGTLSAGKIYVLRDNAGAALWSEADADAEIQTKGLLGLALGTSPTNDGLLVRGIRSFSNSFTVGAPIYISLTAGTFTDDLSSHTTGDFVRVIGYALSTQLIYLDPSPDYIELS